MSLKKIVSRQTWIPQVKGNAMARYALKLLYNGLPNHVKQEIRISAAVAGIPLEDAIACNFSYEVALVAASSKIPTLPELLKSFAGIKAQPVGCTTFIIMPEMEDDELAGTGAVFARNLDWPDPDGFLKNYGMIKEMRVPKPWIMEKCGVPSTWSNVTFPGYSGVLTAYAEGRFAVALNAIMTDDPPRMGSAPTFLLRKVMDECPTFDKAVEMLSKTPLLTSAMFTVMSADPFAKSSDAVVIERSPTRFAVRRPEQIGGNKRLLVATNDTRLMACDGKTTLPTIGESSCKRYDRVFEGVIAGEPVRDILKSTEFGCTIHSVSVEPFTTGLQVW
jgi:hypothetical protein